MVAISRKVIPNDEKLKELILYLAIRSEGDEYFGAKKLNKLLFFSDFLAYLNFGQPISGHEYQAIEFGPAPRQMLPIRREMEQAGDIKFVSRDFYGREQHRVVALREPNLEVFNAKEIDLINRLMDMYRGMTAKQIESDSHRFGGWAYSGYGETIPYETALVGERSLTEGELAHAGALEPLALELLATG